MALTKLMHMKQSSKSNPAAHLKNGINYIMKEEKTGGGMWIGGTSGSTPNEVYQTFIDTKKNMENHMADKAIILLFPLKKR